MTAVDNHELVASLMPATDDGDTFMYTELLNREAKQGNNHVRVVRTFFHSCREQFLVQWPTIKALADAANVRAYTRLGTRSYKRVGAMFTQMVVEAALVGHWQHMGRIYSSACGRSAPVAKRWLFDVDAPSADSEALRDWLHDHDLLFAVVPSRKGYHLISRPFNAGQNAMTSALPAGVELHKDNPTNLYIPAGAA